MKGRIILYFALIATFSALVASCSSSKKQDDATKNEATIPDSIAENQAMYVSPKEAFEFTQKNQHWVLLDVRTPQEVAASHITNASPVNFRSPSFNQQVQLLDKAKIIYVYCNTGVGRSDSAYAVLKNEGFDHVKIIKGGLWAWTADSLPVTQTTNGAVETAKKTTLEDFQKLIQSKQPVLVDFHTLWCASCVEMIPVVDSIKQEYKGKAIVTRVNVAVSKEVRDAFHVSGVPVLVIFVDGKKQWEHKGKITKAQLESKLNEYLS